MGVGAGLYMYVVIVQKFTFAISSPDEFLSFFRVVVLCLVLFPLSFCRVSVRVRVGVRGC